MFFHKHNWVEVERFYAPPIYLYKDGDVVPVSNPKDGVKLNFGVTTIHYQCSTCPKHKWKEVLGKEIRERNQTHEDNPPQD